MISFTILLTKNEANFPCALEGKGFSVTTIDNGLSYIAGREANIVGLRNDLF